MSQLLDTSCIYEQLRRMLFFTQCKHLICREVTTSREKLIKKNLSMPSKARKRRPATKQSQEVINLVRLLLTQGAEAIKHEKNSKRIMKVASEKYKFQDGILYYNKGQPVEEYRVKEGASEQQVNRALELQNIDILDSSLFERVQVFKDDWLIVPNEEEIQNLIYNAHHTLNHGGRDAVEAYLSKQYLINNLQQKCRTVRKKCETCARTEKEIVLVKDNHYKFTHVGHRIFCDCAFFPKANRVIGWVLFDDGLSKFRIGHGIKNKKGSTIVRCCMSVLQFYLDKNVAAKDITFVSDNGGEFKGGHIDNFLKSTGVKWHYVPAGRPQANGQIERGNGTIKRALRKIMLQNNSVCWPRMFGDIIGAYNHTQHSTTKYPPAELIERLVMPDSTEMSKTQLLQHKMKIQELVTEVSNNIANRASRNDRYKIKKAMKGGIPIDDGYPIGTIVRVSSIGTTNNQNNGDSLYSKKAVIVRDYGNNYYDVKFLETGGYRLAEVPGSVAMYSRANLKLYEFGSDHQLTFNDSEEEPLVPLDDLPSEIEFDPDMPALVDQDLEEEEPDILIDDDESESDDEDLALFLSSESDNDNEEMFGFPKETDLDDMVASLKGLSPFEVGEQNLYLEPEVVGQELPEPPFLTDKESANVVGNDVALIVTDEQQLDAPTSAVSLTDSPPSNKRRKKGPRNIIRRNYLVDE